MSTWLFYTSGFAFLAGVLIATATPLGVYAAAALVLSAAAVFVYALAARRIGLEVHAAMLISAAVMALAVGVVRTEITQHGLGDQKLAQQAGERVTLVGTVDHERDERSDYTRLTLSVDRLVTDAGTSTVQAGVQVFAPRYPQYGYGDRLRVTGELSRPESFETETGRVFRYDTYLAKDGVSYTVQYPKITQLAQGEANPVIGVVFDVKQAFLGRMNHVLAEPESALAGGILLGVKQSLGETLETQFRDTGLIHIVVLSGYNVTIVAVFLMAVLARLGLGIRVRTIVGVIGIVLFAVMVGLGATVVRASILAILVFGARALGERFHIHRGLMLAAVSMVMINPLSLVYDPSFQLSFIATLGLVYLTPLIEPAFRWVTVRGGIFEIVTATVSTQLAVLPLLLYLTGSFSLVAIPVNVLALPVVAPAMLASFCAGLIAFLSPVIAVPLAFGAHALLTYIIGVVRVFAAMPLAHVVVPPFSVWIAVGVYVLVVAGVTWWYLRHGFRLSHVMAQHW